MLCLQSPQQSSQPELTAVAETPSPEPKATAVLFLSLRAKQASDPATAFHFQSCAAGTFSCIVVKS